MSSLADFSRYCCGKPGCENDCERDCPRCGKPLVRFDVVAPETTGTTCNPINSPDCWGAAEADGT